MKRARPAFGLKVRVFSHSERVEDSHTIIFNIEAALILTPNCKTLHFSGLGGRLLPKDDDQMFILGKASELSVARTAAKHGFRYPRVAARAVQEAIDFYLHSE